MSLQPGQRVARVHDDYHHPTDKPMIGTVVVDKYRLLDGYSTVNWDDSTSQCAALAEVRALTGDDEKQAWIDWVKAKDQFAEQERRRLFDERRREDEKRQRPTWGQAANELEQALVYGDAHGLIETWRARQRGEAV